MVLQKRLDYGFIGYQMPATPRAARSAGRRSAFKKKGEDNQVSPFDLLAAVAGKLLLEGGNSSSSSNNALGNGEQFTVSHSNVKKEPLDEDQTVKEESCRRENAPKGFFISEILPESHQMQSFEGSLSPPKDLHFGSTSVITTSGSSERFGTQKLVKGETKREMGSVAGDFNRSEHNGKESMIRGINDDMKLVGNVVPKDEHPRIGSGYKSPDYENSVPSTSPDDVDLDSRVKDDDDDDDDDDDENFSSHAQISNTTKSFRSTPRIGDRRIRKILASKYWTVSSKPKDTTVSNSDLDLKPGYCSRKNYYRPLRSERNYPIKKRRYFDCYTVSKSDEGADNEELSGSPLTAVPPSIAGHNKAFQSRDSHVKVRIKSFRVPELFIEIPETATVGSLKRTVLEAVTAILGGGLRIGVLVQGKKIRDDNKTLLQTGISQDSLSDALGFCLEPNPSQSPKPLCHEDSDSLIPCNAPQPLIRNLGLLENLDVLATLNNMTDSDHDSTHSSHKATADKREIDYSRALIPVPPLRTEAITAIPPRKSKQAEVAQRRIRRPFSVAEVEALVQAVERLGTGRWRDVKLLAFDNAKHRTYVDLKDKWKTLVHTARISPQQRRGEPVPQELLDRVLTAHAFWSQQQGKHHPQSQPQQRQRPETSLVL